MKKERAVYAKKHQAERPKHNLSIPRALLFSLLAIIALLAFSCDNAWVIAILPPEYGISLSINGTHELTPEAVGYTAPVADTVTIANTGVKATGTLSVELSGADSGSFSLSAASISSIARGGTNAFTIAPITGLEAGNYTTTIIVSGGNGIRAGFAVSLAVGDGSAPYPFIVHNEETLRKVGTEKTDGSGSAGDGTWNLWAYYKQTKDIDLSGKADWLPIGTATAPFQGNYNGNGHYIKGLHIDNISESNQAMFAILNGTVQGLGLVDASISGLSNVGGIAGQQTGGLIESCYVTGVIVANNSPNDSFAGGVAGQISGSTITIRKSYSNAAISAYQTLGGLVGNNNGGDIEDCYALGSVTGGTTVIGGLVGRNNSGTISNCYAMGIGSGSSRVGGVFGYNGSSSYLFNCVALNPSLERSSGSNPAFGRVIGSDTGGSYTNCFALAGMTLPEDANGYNGTDFYNTGQAAWSAAAPDGPGFDFDNVWEWDSAKNRPILRGVGGQ